MNLEKKLADIRNYLNEKKIETRQTYMTERWDERCAGSWGMIKMAQWEARYQEKWKRKEEKKKQDA